MEKEIEEFLQKLSNKIKKKKVLDSIINFFTLSIVMSMFFLAYLFAKMIFDEPNTLLGCPLGYLILGSFVILILQIYLLIVLYKIMEKEK